jgi:hypothetical protein
MLGSSFTISEKKALKRVCGPKGKLMIWKWKELSSEELHNLCSSPNITSVLKSKCTKKAENVACFKAINIHNNRSLKP